MHMRVCNLFCVYIYIYVKLHVLFTEREREREREREGGGKGGREGRGEGQGKAPGEGGSERADARGNHKRSAGLVTEIQKRNQRSTPQSNSTKTGAAGFGDLDLLSASVDAGHDLCGTFSVCVAVW